MAEITEKDLDLMITCLSAYNCRHILIENKQNILQALEIKKKLDEWINEMMQEKYLPLVDSSNKHSTTAQLLILRQLKMEGDKK